MKQIRLTLLVFITFYACKSTGIDFTKSNPNSIALYNYENKQISIEEITRQWTERLQKDEDINVSVTKLEITKLTDLKSNKSVLVLLGHTNRITVKTATKLTKFKNGLKLSNHTVTCKNCESDLNIALENGDWSCLSKETGGACTKIETMNGI